MNCDVTTTTYLQALFVLLTCFGVGVVVGYAWGARKRLNGLEKKIEALEVRAGLRRAS